MARISGVTAQMGDVDGPGDRSGSKVPSGKFQLLALDRLVPLLEVLLSEVPLLLDVSLEEPPLLEVPLLVEP